MSPLYGRSVLLVAFGSAGVIALAVSAQTYLSMLGHGHSFARVLAWQCGCWGFWAVVAPWILRRASDLGDSSVLWWRRLRLAALIGILAIGGHIVVAAYLMVWLQPYLPYVTQGIRDALVEQALTLVPVDLLVYAVLLLVGCTAALYHRARELELRESRLEADLARAQLDALRLEIEPHFLFNTLNSIASLIRIRAGDRALSMLVGLSELMRLTVDGTRAHTTTLASEIAFVRRYIDLQRIRFGDRLEVAYAIAAEAEPYSVPTLLLQPIVENAFRHGLAKRSGPCRLDLSASVAPGTLHVQIRDNGAGLPAGFTLKEQVGTGLRNTCSRLEHLYAGTAHFELESPADGGTIAHIRVPTQMDRDERRQVAG